MLVHPVGLAAAALVTSCALAAQNHNPVLTNNEPYFTVSPLLHPSTGQNYAAADVVPAAFLTGGPGSGVRPGTWRWRTLPAPVHFRAEPHRVSGATWLARNSAATVAPNLASYLFAWTLRPAVPAAGTPLPDFAAAPLLAVPRATGGGGSLNYQVSVAFAPAALTFADVAVACRYEGGEHDDKDANGGAGPAQSLLASWSDGPTPFPTDGHYDEQGQGLFTYNAAGRAVFWSTYLEEAPVCRAHSSWGQRRGPTLVPELRGHSIGTYYSDLVSGPAPRQLGWDICAGPVHAGELAFPLLSVGVPRRTGVALFGQMLEVDPADPAFGLLQGVYVATLDAAGSWRGPKLDLPRFRGGAGLALGMEFALFDATFRATGTTAAQWVAMQ